MGTLQLATEPKGSGGTNSGIKKTKGLFKLHNPKTIICEAQAKSEFESSRERAKEAVQAKKSIR